MCRRGAEPRERPDAGWRLTPRRRRTRFAACRTSSHRSPEWTASSTSSPTAAGTSAPPRTACRRHQRSRCTHIGSRVRTTPSPALPLIPVGGKFARTPSWIRGLKAGEKPPMGEPSPSSRPALATSTNGRVLSVPRRVHGSCAHVDTRRDGISTPGAATARRRSSRIALLAVPPGFESVRARAHPVGGIGLLTHATGYPGDDPGFQPQLRSRTAHPVTAANIYQGPVSLRCMRGDQVPSPFCVVTVVTRNAEIRASSARSEPGAFWS